jgi:quinol monooxygenase YgiN
MIGGIKHVQVKPGAEPAFEAAFDAHVAETRAHEPGTLSYERFRAGAPGRYVVLDRYRDAQALAQHVLSPGGRESFPKMRGLIETMEVRYFTTRDAESYTAVALTRAPAAHTFALAASIDDMPRWATRFCQSMRREGEHWVVTSPQGKVVFRLEPDPEHHIVWHGADTGTGELRMPMHVVPHGPGTLLLFTIQRPRGVDEAAFAQQCDWVDEEVGCLKALVEG